MTLSRAGVSCVIVATAILAVGCGGPVVTAAGESDDLVIVRDDGAQTAGRALVAVMESPVGWLLDEEAYRVAEVSPDKFKLYANRRHLLLAGVWGQGGVADLVRRRVRGLDRESEPNLVLVEDIWARGQVVGVIMGRDDADLAQYIERAGTEILERFEGAAVRRAARVLKERGVKTGMEAALEQRFGWSLAPPQGYELFAADSEEGLAFLRRTDPDRTVAVYWQDGEPGFASAEFAIAKREELGQRYFDGDEIEWQRELVIESVEFAGRPAIRLAGWWANRTLIGGGPFISYCFFEPSQGRLYLVDASLFAPAMDKVPLMRNLDAIARTFTPGGPGD